MLSLSTAFEEATGYVPAWVYCVEVKRDIFPANLFPWLIRHGFDYLGQGFVSEKSFLPVNDSETDELHQFKDGDKVLIIYNGVASWTSIPFEPEYTRQIAYLFRPLFV